MQIILATRLQHHLLALPFFPFRHPLPTYVRGRRGPTIETCNEFEVPNTISNWFPCKQPPQLIQFSGHQLP